jgi:hypothetical protein
MGFYSFFAIKFGSAGFIEELFLEKVLFRLATEPFGVPFFLPTLKPEVYLL